MGVVAVVLDFTGPEEEDTEDDAVEADDGDATLLLKLLTELCCSFVGARLDCPGLL
jgi:hypothetical protein